jgi:glycerophosphoryl diester phosphodiesterase
MRSRILIVAHRGATMAAPPNTLDAFEAAIRLGADMIEFDVRRTMDDELVVFHDEDIGGSLLVNLRAGEVIEADVPAGRRVPRVVELLDAVRGRVRLDVELKEGGYEDRVLDLLFDRGFGVSDFIVTSFDATAIERVKRARPDVRAGLLVCEVTPQRALEMFLESQADFLGPDCAITGDWLLREAGVARVGLLPWTVNEPEDIRRLLSAPAVFGVITDRTPEALEIRAAITR